MGTNATHNSKFDNVVKMWVFEEMVNGSKLTEIINTTHENVKYLPGHKLPENVVRRSFVWPVNGPAPLRLLLKSVLDLDCLQTLITLPSLVPSPPPSLPSWQCQTWWMPLKMQTSWSL